MQVTKIEQMYSLDPTNSEINEFQEAVKEIKTQLIEVNKESRNIPEIQEIVESFKKILQEGSSIYNDKKFEDAVSKFTEGINIFKTNKGLYDGAEELLEGIGVGSFQELYDYLIYNKDVNQIALKKLADFFFDERLQSYENQLFCR